MSGFPLSSLAVEGSEQFGVEWEGKMDERAGNYFALATAFPSSKLQKNGVRISSSLSCTLGCPTAGKMIFVHPVCGGSLTCLMNGDAKLCSSNPPLLYHCKELYVKLLPFKTGLTMNVAAPFPSKNYPEKTPNQYENGKVSSPLTPVSKHSKLNSPSPSRLSSLSYEDSASRLSITKGTSFDSIDMQEVFGDENAKKLLEHTAVSWLFPRAILCGNLVTIPVLSRVCFFEVVGGKKLSDDGIDEECKQWHDSDEAFIINHATKLHVCLPSDLASQTAVGRRSTPGYVESRDINVKMGDEVAKFKDLSSREKEKLWKEYKLLKNIISSSVKNALSSLGLRTTKGVLLHGPPGTGKTSLAQLCARDVGVNLFRVNGPEVVGQYHGESEQALHDVFKSASEASLSVILIDELDAIAPARKEGGEELSQRMVATLLNLMDGISRTDGLLIIAVTNRLDCIEPALRRPGRLDREIEIGVPSVDQRCNILETLLDRMEHSLKEEQIKELAKVTHGFVGADLEALKNEAAMVCLRRYIMSNKSEDYSYSVGTACEGFDGITERSHCPRDYGKMFSEDNTGSPSSENTVFTLSTTSMTSSLKVTFEDFELARIKIRPSAMREVILEVPKVDWEDVGGQKEVKAQLMEAVEWPQKHQDAFERIGTRPPTGILMFGPPGCSKTLLARAVASKAGLNFLAVKGPELFSKWVGESEKAIRSLFAKARANAPSIIFFDEIDSIAGTRGREKDGVSVADRVVNQLLVELDGLHERVNVTVIAATNCPENIDTALLRPGRFDRLLYVGPPNEMDRVDVFRVHLRKMPCSSDVDMKELARLTEGCTGADISSICREAAISAIEENLDASAIKMEHLKNAILHVHPSEIQPYQDLPEKFQRLVHSKAQSNDLECQSQLIEQKGISSWNPVKWTSQLGLWLSAALSRQYAS